MYLEVATKVDHPCFHHQKKWYLYEMIEVLTNPTVIITWQCVYQIIMLYTSYLNKAEKKVTIERIADYVIEQGGAQ